MHSHVNNKQSLSKPKRTLFEKYNCGCEGQRYLFNAQQNTINIEAEETSTLCLSQQKNATTNMTNLITLLLAT